MDELIARLESATVGSLGLDESIYRLLFSGKLVDPWRRPGVIWTTDLEYTPSYTTSIDAALTLLPPWSWRVGNLPSGRAFASLGTQASMQEIVGATPALALCIACLKARRGAAP